MAEKWIAFIFFLVLTFFEKTSIRFRIQVRRLHDFEISHRVMKSYFAVYGLLGPQLIITLY